MDRQFEWDDAKAAQNWKDHRVSFDEAIEAFKDLNAIEEVDEDHSTEDETRFYRIGLSGTRLVYVVFTI